MDTYTARLRADPRIPLARTVTGPQLEDHARSYLIDVFQSLTTLLALDGEPADGEEASLLRDGSRIQGLISDLHGRQRHRLGWTKDALEREYEILGEEIRSFTRRYVSEEYTAPALDILLGSLERARDGSMRGLVAAGDEG